MHYFLKRKTFRWFQNAIDQAQRFLLVSLQQKLSHNSKCRIIIKIGATINQLRNAFCTVISSLYPNILLCAVVYLFS